MATREIDNTQTAESQPYPRGCKNTFIVRPAVNDSFVHAVHQFLRNFRRSVEFEDSSKAAHEILSLLRGQNTALAGQARIEIAIGGDHAFQAEMLDSTSAGSLAQHLAKIRIQR